MTLKKSSLENNTKIAAPIKASGKPSESSASGKSPKEAKRRTQPGFFSLLSFRLKKNPGLWLLGLVVMLFAYPVNMGMQLSYYASSMKAARLLGNEKRIAELSENMAEAVNRILMGEYSFLWIIIFFAAVICALFMFGWVYSKRQVDFYNSRPVTRTTEFFASYLAGALVMLLCLAAGLVSALLVAVSYGRADTIMLSEAVLINLRYMLMFLFIYSFSVLTIMLTGSWFNFFSSLFWIFFFAYISGFAISGLCDAYLKTVYISPEVCETINKFTPFYPVSRYYSALSSLFYRDMFAEKPAELVNSAKAMLFSAVAASGVIAAAVTLLSWRLFKKRDSEAAGRAFSFNIIERPVRMLFTVLFAILFSLFGAMISSSIDDGDLFWTLFFLITGGLLAHGVVELIYHRDIRAILRDRIELIICAVLSIAIVFCFKYDALRYDRWLPEASELESVEISYADFIKEKDIVERAKYFHTDEYYKYSAPHITVTDEEDIESLLSLIKASRALTGTAPENDDYYSSSMSGEDFKAYDHRMEFIIKTKSGRREERHYVIPSDAITDCLVPLLETKEARETLYPIIKLEKENFGILGVALKENEFNQGHELETDLGYGSASENINSAKGEEAAWEIIEALKTDLSEIGFDSMLSMNGNKDRKGDYYRTLIYIPKEEVMFADEASGHTGEAAGESASYSLQEFYYIPPEFENTVAALQKYGY